jgi:hypothetical protein
MKKMIAILVGSGLALGASPAFAGEWRLDARRCADVREDWRDGRENRRDERIDYGRRDRVEDNYDRREDRRDRAVTVCPRSAFHYVDGRRDDHRGRNRYRDDERQPQLELRYDSHLRMKFAYHQGRKIYVRG